MFLRCCFSGKSYFSSGQWFPVDMMGVPYQQGLRNVLMYTLIDVPCLFFTVILLVGGVTPLSVGNLGQKLVGSFTLGHLSLLIDHTPLSHASYMCVT